MKQQDMKNRKKKGKRPPGNLRNRRRLAVTAAAAAAMGLVTLSVCFFLSQSARYEMKTDGLIYEYGDQYQIRAGSTIRLEEEAGEAYIENSSSKQALDGLPIYLGPDSGEFLEAVPMVYKDPRRAVYGKLPAATVVSRQNAPYLAEHKGKSVELDRGFLFDGSNIYVFLEEILVEFNSREVTLPSMSYVKAVPGGQIELFNYDTKEFRMEELTGEARACSKDYTVSLTGDTLLNADGTREILANRPSALFSLME